MNPTRYAAKLREEMEKVKTSMVEPGYDDFLRYREALAKYHALKSAQENLRLTTMEQDEEQ